MATDAKKRKLKAYMVHDGEPGEHAELVVAFTARDAKNMAYPCFDNDFVSVKADRCKDADEHIKDLEPMIVVSTKIRRLCGWHCEGDERCVHCDLASMDGDYPVCFACGACCECGCEDDCEEKETENADRN